MSCEWVEAQNGKRFVLTSEGAKIGRVKAKYASGRENLYYRRKVPKSWVDKKWVIEIVDK